MKTGCRHLIFRFWRALLRRFRGWALPGGVKRRCWALPWGRPRGAYPPGAAGLARPRPPLPFRARWRRWGRLGAAVGGRMPLVGGPPLLSFLPVGPSRRLPRWLAPRLRPGVLLCGPRVGCVADGWRLRPLGLLGGASRRRPSPAAGVPVVVARLLPVAVRLLAGGVLVGLTVVCVVVVVGVVLLGLLRAVRQRVSVVAAGFSTSTPTRRSRPVRARGGGAGGITPCSPPAGGTEGAAAGCQGFLPGGAAGTSLGCWCGLWGGCW